MKTLILVLTLLSIKSFAITFEEKFFTLRPNISDLFYSPKNNIDRKYLKAGQYNFWQQYGRDVSNLSLKNYKGYIIFSDPFHYGQNKISFLLGSDCSHFVHRIYQIFGANFPYAKTRHFISLAEFLDSGLSPENYYSFKALSNYPINITKCSWLKLSKSFTLIKNDKIKNGDIIVFPRRIGTHGPNGHMGIIWNTSPLKILHSKGKNEGLIIEDLILSENKHYVFRWTLNNELYQFKSQYSSFQDLLKRSYQVMPYKCLNTGSR